MTTSSNQSFTQSKSSHSQPLLQRAKSYTQILSSISLDRMPAPHEQNLEVERRRTQDVGTAIGTMRDVLVAIATDLEDAQILSQEFREEFSEETTVETDPYKKPSGAKPPVWGQGGGVMGWMRDMHRFQCDTERWCRETEGRWAMHWTIPNWLWEQSRNEFGRTRDRFVDLELIDADFEDRITSLEQGGGPSTPDISEITNFDDVDGAIPQWATSPISEWQNAVVADLPEIVALDDDVAAIQSEQIAQNTGISNNITSILAIQLEQIVQDGRLDDLELGGGPVDISVVTNMDGIETGIVEWDDVLGEFASTTTIQFPLATTAIVFASDEYISLGFADGRYAQEDLFAASIIDIDSLQTDKLDKDGSVQNQADQDWNNKLLIHAGVATISSTEPVGTPEGHIWINPDEEADPMSSFLIEVKKGNIGGHSLVQKFGRDDSVGTSFSPVHFGGVWQTPQPASATTLRIKAGGDANDTAAGTGAREVTLQGLDATGAEIEQSLATAGASASAATALSFMRLFRYFVSGSGTYGTVAAGSHADDIVIENGAGGTDWGTLDSTDFARGQSECACYSIPDGKTGYFLKVHYSTDSSKTTNILIFQRQNIVDASAPYDAVRLIAEIQTEGEGDWDPEGSVQITGPADVFALAKVDVGTAAVKLDFDLLLVNA